MELVNVKDPKNLEVPVKITLPIPETINPDWIAILHYNLDGSYQQVPIKTYLEGEQWYVSFVLTSFSDFTMTEETGFPDKPIYPENPDQPGTKLKAPEDLEWHKYYSDDGRRVMDYKGMIAWKEDMTQPAHKTLVKVYRKGDAGEEDLLVWPNGSWNSIPDSDNAAYQRTDHDFINNESMGLEAGSYYFTVQLVNGENCADSEIVRSDLWEYTPPVGGELSAPTGMKWEWPTAK